MRKQGGDAENQGGNLGVAIEKIQESNGNDKFKEWREVQKIENEHIFKKSVLHIQFYKIHFYFYFGHISHNAYLVFFFFFFFVIDFEQKKTGLKG